MYVAIVNTPGYLPDDEPVKFDTASEAWAYLADERMRDEHEHDGTLSSVYAELDARANRTAADGTNVARSGTVYGDTPGYDGDHDLGIAYSVEPAED
jgi:hypothetical protein